MSHSNATKTNHPAPIATAALLGVAPLVKGENTQGYDALLGRITATLQPRDCLEEIWIREIVDLVWETFWLRRVKAVLLTDEARSEVAGELRSHNAEAALADEWATGGDEAAQTLYSTLGSAGLSLQVLTARAIAASYNLEKMQRIDCLLVSVEARRAAALRELEAHRRPLGQKLRLAIAQEEAAERSVAAPRLAAEEQSA